MVEGVPDLVALLVDRAVVAVPVAVPGSVVAVLDNFGTHTGHYLHIHSGCLKLFSVENSPRNQE